MSMILKETHLPLNLCIHCYLFIEPMSKQTHQDKLNRLLAFIQRYIDHHGFAPTLFEMKNALQITSKASTAYVRDRLVDLGYLEFLGERRHRSVTVTETGKTYLDTLSDSKVE